ncbi:Protein kinase C-binding protein 1 [Pseudolycoriella hygida]|uniref:Protein kinase C-binding protein 1 n=1 Tax=Pseudolycoriella hygida TaxID=35572 RepID=A0A9Q0MNH3_9DIPT|nr:Protein kinase C-binding protein 1 [Pseudolycoriella hygida]
MKKVDISSADVHRLLPQLTEIKCTENLSANDKIQTFPPYDCATNAAKQTIDKDSDRLGAQTPESLPKVLYLKKVPHPALPPKGTGSMNTIKEPIPKLIFSTKPITPKQLITPGGIRYITTARKSASLEGITSQDKRLVVCESPTTTDPFISPHSSPTSHSPKIFVAGIKSESKELDSDAMEIEENMMTTEPASSSRESNEERVPASNSNTPRSNREMKQLQKTMKESKVLADVAALMDETKRIKRRLMETEENQQEASPSPLLMDLNEETNLVRSRSLSLPKETNDYESISARRNTRSLNAEFSAKQKKFLAGIQKHSRESDEDQSDDERGRGRRKIRKSGKLFPPLKPGYDKYCWQCHQSDPQIACTHCKRTYHVECLKTKQLPKTENQKLIWECPECVLLENSTKDTEKVKYDLNQLCTMLEFALQRLKSTSKSLTIPLDADNIIHSVSFATMEQKIANKEYQSTHSFLTDCRWILHNCTIFYSRNVKLLAIAKTLFKVSKQEIYDIDTCHECYYNANTFQADWFVEVCSRPHILVWAKLKGFPYWPAKAMTTNSQGMVDVRFFGDHDRAFVPIRECFLYSKDHPNPITVKSKRQSIAHSVVEVDKYINKLTEKYGSFVFAECKTLYDPLNEEKQLEQMIPNYRNYVNNPNKKSSSNSDLTYKIVKTADNHLSIFKKNDKAVHSQQQQETVQEKTPQKHGKIAIIEALDDLKYRVMKRDNDKSRMDGRVDTVILKRKAESPSPANAEPTGIKKMKLDDSRRMSSPTIREDVLSADVSTKPGKSGQTALSKSNKDKEQKINVKNKSETTKSSETSLKEAEKTAKSNSNLDLITAVVKKLDKLQAFVSTNENCKMKNLETLPQSSLCNENVSSSDNGDKAVAVIAQRNEPSKHQMESVPANRNQRKSDDDDNLLVPMQVNEMNDSKKDLQIPAIDSKRQESVSGSSIQSINTDPDDPLEISIKTEPLDDDEIDNSLTNNDSTDPIISQPNNHSQNGSPDVAFSKISVKNIKNLMSRPSEQPQKPPIGVRATSSKSILRPDLVRQRSQMRRPMNVSPSGTSNVQQLQQQQNSQLKQSQNMVCIPVDRSNFQRMESMRLSNFKGTTTAHVKSNPPPLLAMSTAPSTKVASNELVPQTKNNCIAGPSTTLSSSVGPPPLSITALPALTDQTMSNSQTHLPSASDNLATAITDLIKHTEPKLTPKPIGPLRFDDGGNQLSSDAGHFSKLLIDNSHKFADFFRSVFEVTLADIASMGCSEAKVQLLELELEQCKMKHAKEIAELKSNTGVILKEMKKNFETEKTKLINETRRQCELDRIRAVEDTKKRQWCAHCGKEAKFYCCWNTSYCDYPCQQQHWHRHMGHCTQTDDVTIGKSYVSKANELPLRQATSAKKSTSVRPIQQPERMSKQLQPGKTIAQPKNELLPAQFKMNRANPAITAAYVSNINVNSAGKINLPKQ